MLPVIVVIPVISTWSETPFPRTVFPWHSVTILSKVDDKDSHEFKIQRDKAESTFSIPLDNLYYIEDFSTYTYNRIKELYMCDQSDSKSIAIIYPNKDEGIQNYTKQSPIYQAHGQHV